MYRDKSGLYLPERYRPQAVVPGVFSFPRPAIISGAASAIAFVTSNTTNSASLTPASASAGTFLLGIAWNGNSSTVPSLPSGFTTIVSGSSGSVIAYRVGWKVHSGSEGSYTWTNANAVVYQIYSGVNATPIGDTSVSSTNTSTWTLPANDVNGAPDSWVVWGGLVGGASITAPTTWTQRHSRSSVASWRCGDTNGPVSSFASQTPSSANARALGFSIELLVA